MTGSGESDFVMARSADVPTVVVSVAVLLAGVASVVVALTVALFESWARREGSTFTVRVRDVVAPFASVPTAPATVPAASALPPAAATKLVPAGIGSEMLTPVASDGPLFVIP